MKQNLYGLTLSELTSLVTAYSEPQYRANQLFSWLYHQRVTTLDQMTNLSKTFRSTLSEKWEITLPTISRVDESSDGTKKYLYPLGPTTLVESAYIPESDRKTLCISTQGGCKMACLFCMTARQGLQTQLTAGQIIGQLAVIPEASQITNLVYMGMGEPLDNTDQVLKSIELFTQGFGISPKKITLSTIGIIPGLRQVLDQTQVQIAISLHSPFSQERKRIMPIESVFPIRDVLEVLKEYDFSNRKLSFEYILFENLNDSADHALELVKLLNPFRCRINLLHYHPLPNTPLKPCPREKMETFQAILKSKGLIATIRKSRGEDIQAACGLLSTRELIRKTQNDEPDY
jgi:23S rRNA (adenine2503-C2)-methyltransferase